MKLEKLLHNSDIPDDIKHTILQEIEYLKFKLKVMEESEHRYRTLVQTIPDIVYTLDTEGRFTFLNSAIEKLGYTRDELIGKHFTVILHADDIEKVSSRHVLEKMKGQKTGEENAPKLFDERRTGARKTSNLELKLQVKGNGPRTGLLETVTTIDASGLYNNRVQAEDKILLGTIGIIRDITEMKKAQKELSEKQNKIEHLEKFLRVCANCHKVLLPHSDEKNPKNWIQLESFISQKTSTTFSHGYCPVCYEKAMEEVKNLKLNNNKEKK